MRSAAERCETILEPPSRGIAAGLNAGRLDQPDGDAMIAHALEAFHHGVSHGIRRGIARLEFAFAFDFGGVLGIAADGPVDRRQAGFDVRLEAIGPDQIRVIQVVRAAGSLGLKEAKDRVEAAPVTVRAGLASVAAEELKEELEEAGAAVAIA